VAQFIRDSAGARDVFTSWLDQLKQQFDANGSGTFWTLITGAQDATGRIFRSTAADMNLPAVQFKTLRVHIPESVVAWSRSCANSV
jgi:hypothetical protein